MASITMAKDRVLDMKTPPLPLSAVNYVQAPPGVRNVSFPVADFCLVYVL
jgi:hypothetical protein